MKISYNWLKWYIPEAPSAEKLADILTYHIAEVESTEKREDGDSIFDINILPNRAHDLLSHQGIARELASLLNIQFADPTPKYKIPESKPTKLVKEIESPKCRRYMGRVIRNIKVASSPDWVIKHLESIGQKSINNIVDATNIVMYDCGQPAHVFDLIKVKGLKLKVRNAKEGEKITLLGGIEKVLDETMMVISDDEGNSLDIAGVKGGKYAELTPQTTDIILEIANFDPISVRKTSQILNILTDAKKRFENDLSPELGPYAMLELSALILEMCPDAIFEDIVDVYPNKQEKRKLSFSANRISKILGLDVSVKEIEDILKRYNFEYRENAGKFEITVPSMRLDLTIEEDMAEEIGRILGYDKVKPKIPKINFKPQANQTHKMIKKSREYLLSQGYSEVMTYTFRDRGEIEVLESASDKKFLRVDLKKGLEDSVGWNSSMLRLLGIEKISDLKIFEIGKVFKKTGEVFNVAYTKDAGVLNIPEVPLEDFYKTIPPDFNLEPRNYNLETKFKMWSLFPFIARDIAVMVPEGAKSEDVEKIIKNNMGNLVVRGPELFDEFKKGNLVSYAFGLVFQSYERTLTDAEINEIMNKITNKIKEKNGWQVR